MGPLSLFIILILALVLMVKGIIEADWAIKALALFIAVIAGTVIEARSRRKFDLDAQPPPNRRSKTNLEHAVHEYLITWGANPYDLEDKIEELFRTGQANKYPPVKVAKGIGPTRKQTPPPPPPPPPSARVIPLGPPTIPLSSNTRWREQRLVHDGQEVTILREAGKRPLTPMEIANFMILNGQWTENDARRYLAQFPHSDPF